ncbi:MAG: tRNA (adenosine(37)-N6)-threonylcarbamoyltransferase complex ATPase subunit type 1 TsaE [Mongoliitalea sp.]
MESNTIDNYALSDIHKVAQQIKTFAQDMPIWVFKGAMGAGKTTLVKAIAEAFGVEDQVSSPTFGLVNEYRNNKGQTFYHFDFYRINEEEEVLDIGIDEYFYSGNYCWLEWAEKIPHYLPEDFVLIALAVDESGKRKIQMNRVIKGQKHG